MLPLENIQILTLAINLPGPLAVARLRQMGASVVKIEPPDGDPLEFAKPQWYRELHDGIKVMRLDLKTAPDRKQLNELLSQARLLITATRPAALARLELSWPELHERYPKLSQVSIVGNPSPHEEMPGHDLTYQAQCGLVAPPALPRACVADWAGSQEVVIASLGLILDARQHQQAGFVQVSLAAAAERFAEPLCRGLTVEGGILGGGYPGYNVYQTREGWIAIAALEPHFWQKLTEELRLAAPTREQLQDAFRSRTAGEWQSWAEQRDLPLVAVVSEDRGS
jgi:crotonobetainyl-CoA:carnitine CoA-transferase CaiB-like acyl-CoA transferase